MHAPRASRRALGKGLGIATILATATLATGCVAGDNGGGDGDGTPANGDKPELSIVYVGPLTGGAASLGVPARNGMEMAVEDINASGDYDFTLKLLTADDEADAAKSTAAVTRLMSDDVVAFVGGPISGTAKATGEIIVEEGHVHLISIAQTDNLVNDENFDLTFRVTEPNSFDTNALIGIFAESDYENICAVADTSEYGQGYMSTIESEFAKVGLELHNKVQHNPGEADLTSHVLKLRDSGCDSIFLVDYGPDAAIFMGNVNSIGWDVDVIGGRALNQAAFIDIAGQDANGLIFPSVIDPNKAATADFIKRYDEKYGADNDPAHTFSALAYDSIFMLAEGLAASGGEGKEALARALETVSIEGVTGQEGSKLSFSADKHEAANDNFLTLFEIIDGKFTFKSTDITSGWN